MAAFALLGNRQGVVFPWASRQLGMIQNTFELWAAVHVFASAFNDRGLESRSSLPGGFWGETPGSFGMGGPVGATMCPCAL